MPARRARLCRRFGRPYPWGKRHSEASGQGKRGSMANTSSHRSWPDRKKPSDRHGSRFVHRFETFDFTWNFRDLGFFHPDLHMSSFSGDMRGRYLRTKRDLCQSEGFPLSEDLRALGQNAPNRRPKIQPEKKAGKPSRRFADGGRAFARESEQDPRIGGFSSKEKGASRITESPTRTARGRSALASRGC